MSHISIFILFCAFQLYQIQNVSSSKKIPFKIDDFINQLMTSKKFSELTDIIAEKAAKKIKSVQQDRKQQYNSDKEFRNTDNAQTDIPEPNTVKKNENESKKGRSTTKFGKINTDAFLKHDIKSGEILLNYKHMTDELKRSDYKTNTQKNSGKKSDRDRGTRPDRDSNMHRNKNSEKPKNQSSEHIIQPRKQLKTNKIYEEIQRNFNKMNKSMDEDSSSAEIYNNVNYTASEEASEEHEIFIKIDEDVAPKVNFKKGPNSTETFDKYANPEEKNEVDTKSIKKPTNSDKNIEKNTDSVKTPEIANKELEEHYKSIKNPERSSKSDKKYNESINDQENANKKFETRAQVMQSSEKAIEAKHKKINKKSSENLKKFSKSIKYHENTNKNLEINYSAKPIDVLIEMKNQKQTKPQKIHLKKFGNMQSNYRSKLHKGTPKFRAQKSETTPKAHQTTEHVEDYSDVLNFEGAMDTLIKEPILKVPYPIISRENGKIYTHNYSEPDYKEYHEKFVSRGNYINLN